MSDRHSVNMGDFRESAQKKAQALLEAEDSGDGMANFDSYGAVEADDFLPLAGDVTNDDHWPDLYELEDDAEESTRISATTLIYLCAISSSLTSVLLGYGERRCVCRPFIASHPIVAAAHVCDCPLPLRAVVERIAATTEVCACARKQMP